MPKWSLKSLFFFFCPKVYIKLLILKISFQQLQFYHINKNNSIACKRDENGEWWRLHNEELHSLYHSRNIVRVIKSRRWAGHLARMEKGRSGFKILTGWPTGKRPLGRPGRWWEDNTRIDLEEIDINAGNLVESAQDWDYWRAFVNTTLNLRVA
jgi:hypothetical protein